ncbi:MAG: nicotinate-nucleotide adenylyltransferase [Proteobacteria bacterium]|nr:nicotinate-nucleotide adenylyltransferase [Pseudomonadota bacterium]
MAVIALLGGSFDPVHAGHVALTERMADLLQPDSLRLIPAGNPWQKPHSLAPATDRIAMLERAFAGMPLPVMIDRQEIERAGPSYAIDTLRAIRAEVGAETSLVFLIGADQLQQLHTWRDWRQLFDLAHFCVASRPGFSLDAAQLAAEIREACNQRTGTVADLRAQPAGRIVLDAGLAFDVSSTAIRLALQQGKRLTELGLVPDAVLDYIQQHHLYQH